MTTDYPNWFAVTAQHNFEKYLAEFKNKDRLRFLQLGAYTGDASLWIAENIFTGKSCLLIDVDTWEGSDEEAHDKIDFNEVRQIYLDKVLPFDQGDREDLYYKPVIASTVQSTVDFLTMFDDKNCYDFIYVDADHTTVGVILDAELSWPKLKSGGIMAFDDYTWGHESGDPRLAPQVGIDLFLHRHLNDYELLAKNEQLWIRKH